jgi:pyridoxamine 5'-phosphate oxidase
VSGSSDLSDLRRDYDRGALTREDLDPDPVQQFTRWFEDVRAAGHPEPNAMGLATAGADGQPTARTVLLKYFDADGFVFFTNKESAKARQLAENPRAGLLFYWQMLERQVIVRGTAEPVSARESLAYFVKRPRGSQLGAWVSDQSRVITSRKILEMKLEEMKRRFGDGEVPLPSFWGGYRVRPEAFEFWQGRPSRLHDRFLYERADGGWAVSRLAP